MKFSAILLGAFAALALAAPAEVPAEDVQARAAEVEERQNTSCSRCIDGWYTCCTNIACNRRRC